MNLMKDLIRRLRSRRERVVKNVDSCGPDPCPCDECQPGAEPEELCGHHDCRMRRIPFTCPRCGRNSYNPDDKRMGWCAVCHEFTAAPDEVEAPDA